MILLALICAFIMGLILGLMGAGGAILTIPIFVYLVHMDAQVAINGSLIVVCIVSLIGGLTYLRKSLVDFPSVYLFGIPSIFTIWLSRQYIVPNIPDPVLQIGAYELSKSAFLLILFSLLLFAAAYKMLTPAGSKLASEKDGRKAWKLIIYGFILGFITGMLGAGGGFLIVPALVIFQNLEFKKAAGTSLMIISINTAVAIVSKFDALLQLDSWFILEFTGVALLGMIAGSKLSNSISSEKLKPLFAYFLIAMGGFILIKEIFEL